MKSLFLLPILLFLITLTSCRNGAVRNVCVETDTREYEYCYNQNSSICEQWDTECRVDSFGQQICSTKCVHYQQVQRCETRYKEVCTAYEKRYYCKALKQWMTESNFNNNCPNPKGNKLLAKILGGHATYSNGKNLCLTDSETNNSLIKESAKELKLLESEVVEMVEENQIPTEKMEVAKEILETDDSKDVFSFIKQVSENNLELTKCN